MCAKCHICNHYNEFTPAATLSIECSCRVFCIHRHEFILHPPYPLPCPVFTSESSEFMLHLPQLHLATAKPLKHTIVTRCQYTKPTQEMHNCYSLLTNTPNPFIKHTSVLIANAYTPKPFIKHITVTHC